MYRKSFQLLLPIFSHTSFTPAPRETHSKRIPSRKLSIIELEKYFDTVQTAETATRPTIFGSEIAQVF